MPERLQRSQLFQTRKQDPKGGFDELHLKEYPSHDGGNGLDIVAIETIGISNIFDNDVYRSLRSGIPWEFLQNEFDNARPADLVLAGLQRELESKEDRDYHYTAAQLGKVASSKDLFVVVSVRPDYAKKYAARILGAEVALNRSSITGLAIEPFVMGRPDKNGNQPEGFLPLGSTLPIRANLSGIYVAQNDVA